MDAVFELLTGAAILASGLRYGYLLGQRNKRPIPEICQCDHPSSMHDKSGCLAMKKVATHWDSLGNPKKWEKRELCPCIRYVGPHSSYVPELEGEPRD